MSQRPQRARYGREQARVRGAAGAAAHVRYTCRGRALPRRRHPRRRAAAPAAAAHRGGPADSHRRACRNQRRSVVCRVPLRRVRAKPLAMRLSSLHCVLGCFSLSIISPPSTPSLSRCCHRVIYSAGCDRCSPASCVIVWFWEWVATLSLKDKQALLLFWSGTNTAPVAGFERDSAVRVVLLLAGATVPLLNPWMAALMTSLVLAV